MTLDKERCHKNSRKKRKAAEEMAHQELSNKQAKIEAINVPEQQKLE